MTPPAEGIESRRPPRLRTAILLSSAALLSLKAQGQSPLDYLNKWNANISAEASCYLPGKEYHPPQGFSPGSRPLTSSYGLLFSVNCPIEPLLASVHLFSPTARSGLSRLFVFGHSQFFLGTRHSDLDPIVLNLEYGGGLRIFEGLGFRFTTSRHIPFAGHSDEIEGAVWNGLSLAIQPGDLHFFDGLLVRSAMELYFFAPHNELDPNTGIDFADRRTARYAIDLGFQMRHARVLPRAFLFGRIFLPLGNSLPQTRYSFDPDPISLEYQLGAGYDLWRHWQVKGLYSFQEDLGGLSRHRPLDWAAISLQWNF